MDRGGTLLHGRQHFRTITFLFYPSHHQGPGIFQGLDRIATGWWFQEQTVEAVSKPDNAPVGRTVEKRNVWITISAQQLLSHTIEQDFGRKAETLQRIQPLWEHHRSVSGKRRECSAGRRFARTQSESAYCRMDAPADTGIRTDQRPSGLGTEKTGIPAARRSQCNQRRKSRKCVYWLFCRWSGNSTCHHHSFRNRKSQRIFWCRKTDQRGLEKPAGPCGKSGYGCQDTLYATGLSGRISEKVPLRRRKGTGSGLR